MMRFVHGSDLTQAICDVLTGNECDLAVAYFGTGATRRLGLSKGKRIRVACDLWSGACNPHELGVLKNLGADIKDARGLHAKVYIGQDAAVVTSANASTNGLGEGGENLDLGLEAGVLLGEASELNKVRGWFESIYRAASDVSFDELEDLKAWWSTRRLPRRPQQREPDSGLLALATTRPDELPGIGFVFTDTINDDDAVARARAAASTSAPDRAEDIERWSRHNMFTGWDASVVRKWPGQFIAYHRGSRGKLWVRAMRMDLRIPSEGAVFCTPDWRGIVTPLVPSISPQDAERRDAAIAEKIINRMDEGEVFTSANELAARLAATDVGQP